MKIIKFLIKQSKTFLAKNFDFQNMLFSLCFPLIHYLNDLQALKADRKYKVQLQVVDVGPKHVAETTCKPHA